MEIVKYLSNGNELNGNILLLLSYSMGIPLNQMLALGFGSDVRELLKRMYEAFPNNENKFEEFMFDLEKIYSVDKLVIADMVINMLKIH